MRSLISVLLLLLPLLSVSAQTHLPDSFVVATPTVPVQQMDSTYLAQIDSLMQTYETVRQQQKVEAAVRQFEALRLKKEMSMSTDGVLPLARGLLLTWTDHNSITHPAQFERKGDGCNWIDYGVAGAPLVANWVMKAAGVKSRSKLERMLTANAMALSISFGASELLKHTIHETRPDRSDRHSFPSGHTATAFLGAELVRLEYGAWAGAGAYAVATLTAAMRVYNNWHWFNDLLGGAAIGIVSANIGYWLLPLERRLLGEWFGWNIAPAPTALGLSVSCSF